MEIRRRKHRPKPNKVVREVPLRRFCMKGSYAEGGVFISPASYGFVDMRREARNWYEGALVDLEEAVGALEGGRVNWALFAAHQAVEKALKAAIIAVKRVRPPRSHDLVELYRVSGLSLSGELTLCLSELTPYYSAARYPNAGLERPWENIAYETASRLVKCATRVVEEVGRLAGFRG